MGNTRVVLDEQGNTKAYYDYFPFGKIQRAYVAGTGARYKFTGKEFDNEDGIGLYYSGARYYDLEIGRWFVTDPAGQFSSPYVYSGNSPLMMVDANGEFAIVPILVMAAWQGFVNYQITGDVGSSFKAAGISALSGAAGQFASSFAPAGVLPGAAYGGATEGVIGGVVSELSGDSFGSGFAIGAAQGVITGGLDGYARYKAAYPIDAGSGSIWTGSASGFRKNINTPVEAVGGRGLVAGPASVASGSLSPVQTDRMREDALLARMSEVGLGNTAADYHAHPGCPNRNDCIVRVLRTARPDLNPDGIWTGNAHRFLGQAVERDFRSLQIVVWPGNGQVIGHAGFVREQTLFDYGVRGLFQNGRDFTFINGVLRRRGLMPTFFDIPGL